MILRIIPDIVQDQDIFALAEECSVAEAARKMLDLNIAAVVVTGKGGKLSGIVTERDLTRRVLAKGLNPDKATIGDIMTRDPDTLNPGDSAVDALELMRTRHYRHLPMVDGERVVGMVSIRDLYAAVKLKLEESIRETEAFVFGDRYGG
jgi:CBS domain-containing protein